MTWFCSPSIISVCLLAVQFAVQSSSRCCFHDNVVTSVVAQSSMGVLQIRYDRTYLMLGAVTCLLN